MLNRNLQIDDRVVDIWYGATGTVVGLPPLIPETDLYRGPWVLVVWDYMGPERFWIRQSDLRVFGIH